MLTNIIQSIYKSSKIEGCTTIGFGFEVQNVGSKHKTIQHKIRIREIGEIRESKRNHQHHECCGE